jgi:hypothetical protein
MGPEYSVLDRLAFITGTYIKDKIRMALYIYPVHL